MIIISIYLFIEHNGDVTLKSYLKDFKSVLITVLKTYVKPSAKGVDTEAAQIYRLPEQCQELRPKHVRLITVFARVICAIFFSILLRKICGFFFAEVLIWVLFQCN
jgi:hypothetical protein